MREAIIEGLTNLGTCKSSIEAAAAAAEVTLSNDSIQEVKARSTNWRLFMNEVPNGVENCVFRCPFY